MNIMNPKQLNTIGRRSSRLAASALVSILVLAGCSSASDSPAPSDAGADPEATVGSTDDTSEAVDESAAGSGERLSLIAAAVDRWETAGTVAAAHAAAEEARNLITGPGTLDSGDLDGDGEVVGLLDPGFLPSETGTPGLASALAGCEAVDQDVLGGSWDDPAERWLILQQAIDDWSEANNTFPSLPSHPQRIVGWATLTLASDDLELAHEYAGHAQLHVRVAGDALDSCT